MNSILYATSKVQNTNYIKMHFFEYANLKVFLIILTVITFVTTYNDCINMYTSIPNIN
jgi:hypothetical protein